MRRTNPLIVGGGPAGAAAAIVLARAGQRPLVIERSREPTDPLCGGFLSWRSLDTLARLGVEADSLNRLRVTRVRLFAGGRVADVALPRPAIGVSRRRLDALLLARAQAAGAGVERGLAVRAWENGALRLADATLLRPDTLVLATGKHDLRGAARTAVRGDDPAMGLRVRLSGVSDLVGDAVELHAFAGGYAGLVVQEDGSANLCMAVRRSRLAAAGSPTALLQLLGDQHAHLGERLAYLDGGTPIDAVANVPYGWRTGQTEPDVYRVGDQAGVIPSLAGEGMGIALASGAQAAAAIAAGQPATHFQRDLAKSLARPLALAGMVRGAVESPRAAPVLVGAAGALPSLVRAVARLTRIKDSAVDAWAPASHLPGHATP